MRTQPKTPVPVSITPKDLSPYRAYLKGRLLVALDIDGDEHYEIAPTPGDKQPFVLSTQADCLVNVLSEEAAIALTIGACQPTDTPVLSKAMVETMVASCLEKPGTPKPKHESLVLSSLPKQAKRGRPRGTKPEEISTRGAESERVSSRKTPAISTRRVKATE